MHICYIIAMQAEAQPFIDAFNVKEQEGAFAPLPCRLYQAEPKAGKKLSIVTLGRQHERDLVGCEAASVATLAAVERLHPDLVVNSGTCGAWARKGADIGKVYVADSVMFHDRRVPGDDESHPIYRAIFDGRRAARPSWPFTYSYDATPDKLHADAKKTVLSNGSFGNAVQDSVQFPCDVTVSVDLGAERDVSGVELSTYLREQRGTSLRTANLASVGFRTAAMEVSASRDGKT
ncbi:MAG: hypothetical protein IKM71_00950, partial [Bacteroidaceae bacterium]|nr:hypothetical protein [Bacteroidaceae bacterium]